MKKTSVLTLWFWAVFHSQFTFAVNNTTTVSIPNHAVILLYHHVETNTPKLTSVSPTDFNEQMNYLKNNHFQIWPLEKITSHLTDKIKIPDKVVGISFDDSYESIYHKAYPILKKYNFPFTIFVSSSAVDEKQIFQSSWEQLKEMSDNGATIANHSSSHAHLLQYKKGETDQEWQQRIRDDIALGAQRIQHEIGQSNKLFAYPYGEYNQQLINIVSSFDYIGFGQQSGAAGENSDFLTLPRFPVAGNYTNIDDFALKLYTLPLPILSIKADSSPLPHKNSQPTLSLEFYPDHNLTSKINCFASNQVKLKLVWESQNKLIISPEQDIATGRSRYNCTALHSREKGVQRYYWYSQPWIRRLENGELVLD